MSDISENLKRVRDRIQRSCIRVGRNPDSVRIIAVTKTHPASVVQQAIGLGLLELGESRVQELLAKSAQIQSPVQWHMIGHLQSNKVRKIVGLVDCIQSIDSLELADAVERVAAERDLTIKVLLQVNTSGEESKFGCGPKQAEELASGVAQLTHLRILGLMTLGKRSANPEDARPGFAQLRELSLAIQAKNLPGVSMQVLSMGMSGDFEIAIEEGATWVRLGEILFGARESNHLLSNH